MSPVVSELEQNPGDLRDVLDKLQEECAELTLSAAKAKSFGLIDKWQGVTNRQQLETEVGDVLCVIGILVDNNIIASDAVLAAMIAKTNKLKQWAPTVAKYVRG